MRSVRRPVLLVLAGCGLTALAAAPAVARTCPSGQFLQVSKGKCISKDSARKLGIAGHAAAKAKPDKAKADKPRNAKAEPAGETRVARTAPESDAKAPVAKEDGGETTLASASPALSAQPLGYAAAPPEPVTVRRNIAPFGALQFGGLR